MLLAAALFTMSGSAWATAGDANTITATGTSTIDLSTVTLGGSYGNDVGYNSGEGAGYLDNFHKGESCYFTVSVAAADKYVVTVQYGTVSNPTLSFSLGEGAQKSLSLKTTGGWTTWEERKFVLDLTTSMNRLDLNWTDTDNENNYTAKIKSITFQPLSEVAVTVSSSEATALTYEQATDKDGLSKTASQHGRDNFFSDADGKTVVYTLYNETAQNVWISGEGASGDTSTSPHYITFTIVDEEGNETTTFKTNNLAAGTDNDWKTWVYYGKKQTLPAGLVTMKMYIKKDSGSRNLNFTAPTITPYSVALSNAVSISSSKVSLTYDQAMTRISKNNNDYPHGRPGHFADAANAAFAVYLLNNTTEQKLFIDGEGASEDSSSDPHKLTITFTKEDGTTETFTTDNLAAGNWDTWTAYTKMVTLPAGLIMMEVKSVIESGSKNLNFTAPSITPYSALVDAAVTVSETQLTHAQATTSEANSGEIKHKKAAAYFNNPSSGFTATYDLYFPTNQTYTVSGELASDNTIDQHNLTYTFTSKESVFAEKTFTKENISVSGWDNWTKYTSDLELEGLVTLTITYTKVGSSASNRANFTAPTFTPASYVSYTIPASGLGTYCSAQKLDFSEVKTSDDEAVKPYVILSGAISDNNITATKVEGVVPAATGIIVKGKGGETVSIPVSTETEASLSGTNLLHGVLTATEVDATSGGSYYVVSGGKLTKVDTKGTIKPNRAYLQIPVGSSRELVLSFDNDSETTGVEEFKNSNMKELKSYYNLSGQRVAQPTKGLYIVNGKKVVVK